MSKVLYPKPHAPARKKVSPPKENLLKRPYHVFYSDPTNEIEPEWRHYNTELAVKVGAWYQCKILGFLPAATLYTRDEMKAAKNVEAN